jgi:hypothetical protein
MVDEMVVRMCDVKPHPTDASKVIFTQTSARTGQRFHHVFVKADLERVMAGQSEASVEYACREQAGSLTALSRTSKLPPDGSKDYYYTCVVVSI